MLAQTDASPIQHKAASKSAWLMNGQTKSSVQQHARRLQQYRKMIL